MILPAFGTTVELLEDLVGRGCTLVDTTCGSVLNVWKNVKRYAVDGYTSIIHGKYWHEETRATASQALHSGRRRLPRGARSRRGRARSATTSATAATPDAFLQAVRARRLAGLRPGHASAARRLRQPDDDAQLGVAGDRRDVPPGDARPLRRRAAALRGSAPSTRSAAPRRTARMRSSPCSTSSRST